MKKTILFLIITASLATTNAQMYNFLGNHVVLNMEGYFSPAWLNPNPVSSGWDIPEGFQKYLGLNYFLSPNIELMVWEKGTVGVGYNYYNSPFKGSDCRLRKAYQYYGYTEWREAELYGNVTAHGFNVYYKQYVGDRFAPLGPLHLHRALSPARLLFRKSSVKDERTCIDPRILRACKLAAKPKSA